MVLASRGGSQKKITGPSADDFNVAYDIIMTIRHVTEHVVFGVRRGRRRRRFKFMV